MATTANAAATCRCFSVSASGARSQCDATRTSYSRAFSFSRSLASTPHPRIALQPQLSEFAAKRLRKLDLPGHGFESRMRLFDEAPAQPGLARAQERAGSRLETRRKPDTFRLGVSSAGVATL